MDESSQLADGNSLLPVGTVGPSPPNLVTINDKLPLEWEKDRARKPNKADKEKSQQCAGEHPRNSWVGVKNGNAHSDNCQH